MAFREAAGKDPRARPAPAWWPPLVAVVCWNGERGRRRVAVEPEVSAVVVGLHRPGALRWLVAVAARP